MRPVLRTFCIALPVAGALLGLAALFQDGHAQDEHAAEAAADAEGPIFTDATHMNVAPGSSADEAFPQGFKYLLPPPVPFFSDPARDFDSERIAFGAVDPDEELAQPIAYSHMLHAGTLQINCEYCHSNARKSIHAGVPPTSVCMNCHQAIPAQGRPELEKLVGYYERGEVIPWVKVHDLPDFVYFSHKRHVQGGVLCQECHGEVQDDMTVARRVGELTMGWCLDCHETHPSVDANYGADAELRRAEIKDCWNCHK